ncbi:MAG: hypothetical protein Q9227_007576 [Pyrenula ochraceoflavens]
MPHDLYSNLPLVSSDSSPQAAIRILVIQPGKYKTNLHAEIKVVPLSPETHFEALSYTWGQASKGKTITLNQRYKFPITDNLYTALQRLRSRDKTRVLWVDAMCINQKDDIEKSHQVRLMGKIYREANCVNVWLGEPDWVFPFDLGYWYETRPSWNPMTNAMISMLGGNPNPPVSKAHLKNQTKAMHTAVHNTVPSWHHRAWTIQECVVAKKVTLYFGSQQLPYDPDVTIGFSTEDSLPYDFTYRMGKLLPYLRSQCNKDDDAFRPISLYRAAHVLEGAQATNKRDMVYSILGLIGPREAELIGSDYTIPYPQVYSRATFVSMEVQHSLDILNLVRLNPEARPEELPSWTVNFANIQGSFNVAGWTTPFNRRVRSSFPRHLELKVGLKSPTLLEISGTYCDEVCSIVSTAGSDKAKVLSALGNLMQDAAGIFSDSLDKGHGSAFTSAVIRALPAKNTCMDTSMLTRIVDAVRAPVNDRGFSTEENDNLWNSHGSMTPKLLPGKPPKNTGCWVDVLASTHIDEESSFLSYCRLNSGGEAVNVFVTKCGLVGIAPSTVAVADHIVFVQSSMPFLALRRLADSQHYQYQGLVYLHGLMQNEFWTNEMHSKLSSVKREEFVVH